MKVKSKKRMIRQARIFDELEEAFGVDGKLFYYPLKHALKQVPRARSGAWYLKSDWEALKQKVIEGLST